MVVIDIIRCFALQPVLDFSTTSEKLKKTHKLFNRSYQLFTLLLMVLVIIVKCEQFKSINDLMDLFTILIIIYLGAIILGILFQVVQCLEKTNQPDIVKDVKSSVIEFKPQKPRGRTALPRVKKGENPLKDDFAKSAFDAAMDSLGNNLSSTDAGNILNSLINCKETFLREDYEKVSLADWLYRSYQSHFTDFEPKSMTTSSGLSPSKIEEITELLKGKYKEKKEKK